MAGGTRNANKFPQIPYTTMVRDMEKRSGLCMQYWITMTLAKVNHF